LFVDDSTIAMEDGSTFNPSQHTFTNDPNIPTTSKISRIQTIPDLNA